jgi:hypothetical protein
MILSKSALYSSFSNRNVLKYSPSFINFKIQLSCIVFLFVLLKYGLITNPSHPNFLSILIGTQILGNL